MAALDLFVLGGGHAVVAQVVEAELGVGAVGDVAGVFGAAFPRRHLVLDAADGETEELIERAHPVGVAAGEVVVDGDDVHAEAGERVEIDRQGGDQGLALAGLHFGDHAAVQGDAADELDVEVHHLPEDRMVVDGDGGAAHAARGVFDDRVGFGQDLFEVSGAGFRKLGFDLVEGGLGGLDRVGGGLDHGGQRGKLLAQRSEAGFQIGGRGGERGGIHALDHRFRRHVEHVIAGKVGLPVAGHFAQFLLGLALQRFFDFIDARDRRADAAHFALVLAADDFLENPLDHVRAGVGRNNPPGRRPYTGWRAGASARLHLRRGQCDRGLADSSSRIRQGASATSQTSPAIAHVQAA